MRHIMLYILAFFISLFLFLVPPSPSWRTQNGTMVPQRCKWLQKWLPQKSNQPNPYVESWYGGSFQESKEGWKDTLGGLQSLHGFSSNISLAPIAPTKHTNTKQQKGQSLQIAYREEQFCLKAESDGSMYLSVTLQALLPPSLQTFKLIIFVDISWKLVNEDNLLNLESAGKKQCSQLPRKVLIVPKEGCMIPTHLKREDLLSPSG